MSNFESSSSSAAQAAVRSAATQVQRKTLNRHALTILPTPSYRAMSYFEAVDSDEEEETIRVALRQANDEYYPSNNNSDDDESSNTVNVTIQCGVLDTIRNAFSSANKNLRSGDVTRQRSLVSAIVIFVMFFLLVGFGASSQSSSSSSSLSAPSGRSMRIARPSIWTPAFAEAHGVPAMPSPPSQSRPKSNGRAARAATVTQRPALEKKDASVVAPTPIAHMPSSDAPAEYVAPYGSVSAKFLVMYVKEQNAHQKREHEHPDNLGQLFGFAA